MRLFNKMRMSLSVAYTACKLPINLKAKNTLTDENPRRDTWILFFFLSFLHSDCRKPEITQMCNLISLSTPHWFFVSCCCCCSVFFYLLPFNLSVVLLFSLWIFCHVAIDKKGPVVIMRRGPAPNGDSTGGWPSSVGPFFSGHHPIKIPSPYHCFAPSTTRRLPIYFPRCHSFIPAGRGFPKQFLSSCRVYLSFHENLIYPMFYLD